ncbi:uncharacterized protein RJT20DRAFT_3156 [Scheffersomyces xylosifermentans]|uniref:uncharacterized protein n=1 Tax=Scheffersomyces xylosifermentans TaxID=1304137 RepID=UPI00315D2226
MAKKLHHLPRNVLESSLRKVSKKALNELSTVENNLQLRSLALQALKNSTPVRLQTVEVIYHKKRTIEEVLQIENKAVLWCRFGDLLDPPLDPILDTYPSVILDIKDVELYKLLSSNPRYIAETRITLYTTCLVTIAPKEEYNIESVVLAFKLSYSQGYLTEAEAMDCFKILNRIFPKASQRYADFHVFAPDGKIVPDFSSAIQELNLGSSVWNCPEAVVDLSNLTELRKRTLILTEELVEYPQCLYELRVILRSVHADSLIRWNRLQKLVSNLSGHVHLRILHLDLDDSFSTYPPGTTLYPKSSGTLTKLDPIYITCKLKGICNSRDFSVLFKARYPISNRIGRFKIELFKSGQVV